MFQPELFKDLPQQQPRRFGLPHFPGRFLRIRVAYEDAVFTALGLILVLLAGFCVGVERGKRMGPGPAVLNMAGVATARENAPASERLPSPVPAAAARSAEPRRALPVIPAGVSSVPAVVSPAAADSVSAGTKGGFAIQLATYVGREMAQEEAKRLAKKGIPARVLKQGKYYELRAGGYRSRAEGKQALGVLRKSYPDAFLKSVSTD